MTADDDTQVATPNWVLPNQPGDYRTAKASENSSQYPYYVRELLAGRTAFVPPSKFFSDRRGRLWLDGKTSILAIPDNDDDTGYAVVERTENGVKVLLWPTGGLIHRWILRPNHDGVVEDMWVVDFPEEPAS